TCALPIYTRARPPRRNSFPGEGFLMERQPPRSTRGVISSGNTPLLDDRAHAHGLQAGLRSHLRGQPHRGGDVLRADIDTRVVVSVPRLCLQLALHIRIHLPGVYGADPNLPALLLTQGVRDRLEREL